MGANKDYFKVDFSELNQVREVLDGYPDEIKTKEIQNILYTSMLPMERAIEAAAPQHRGSYSYKDKDGKVRTRKMGYQIDKYAQRRKSHSGERGRMKGVKDGMGRVTSSTVRGNLAFSTKRFKGSKTTTPTVFVGPAVRRKNKRSVFDGWYARMVVFGSKYQAPNDYIKRGGMKAMPLVEKKAKTDIGRYMKRKWGVGYKKIKRKPTFVR